MNKFRTKNVIQKQQWVEIKFKTALFVGKISKCIFYSVKKKKKNTQNN